MASQPRQFTIEKQTYRGATPEGLAPVPMPTGEAGQAAAAGFGALAEKFSRWADQDAKFEGERDARIAAASGDFTQTGQPTIYGRTRDATALDAQLNSVTATFRDRTLALFDEHRNDPAGLRAALEREANDHAAALPPEAQAGFRTRASDIGVVLQRQAINNSNSRRESEARATLLRRTGEAERHQSQLLAVGPTDPAAEAEARKTAAEQVAHIRGLVADNLLDPAAGEKLVMDTMQGVEGRIIQARAATLRTPEEVTAYRNHLRQEFQAGRLVGLTDIASVDAELDKLARAKGVEQERQAKALQTSLDDALARAGRGQQPTAAEMATLEAEAAKLGPRGAVMLENSRARMGLAQQLAGRSLPEQQRIVDQLAAETRAGAGTVSPQADQALTFFMSRGWTRVQAAAIVGHMVKESQLDTNARNPGDGRDGSDSIGVAQWNAGRAQALASFAAARGKPVTDFQTQLAFADAELRGQIPGSDESQWGRQLAAAADVRSASRAMISYLRPRGWTSANPEGGHNFAARTAVAERLAGATSRGGAEVVQWGREQVNANRNAINADMLGYAADRGLAGGPMTVLELGGPPDQLTNQMRSRVAQVDAVAPVLGQANPSYLRPDDKAALQGIVTAGGDRALATVEAIVRGGGARATTILKEIGGDAPALAHAAALSTATGDRSFARTVAEGLAARQVAGSSPQRPSNDDMDAAERKVLGAALRGLRTDERERTRAAVSLWVEVQAQRRGIDLKANASGLIEEGFRAARGETRQGDNTYGGVTTWRSPAWFGGSTEVQVPPNVRQDRFNDVLKAITSQDLAALPNPPVFGNGNPMDAEALRRMQPIFGPGGYRFAMPPDSNGNRRPVIAKDGQPFVLPFAEMEPVLRARVPGAFR
jgi:hypothetical protein